MDLFKATTTTKNSSITKGDVFHPFRRESGKRKLKGLSQLRRTRLKRMTSRLIEID